MKSKLKTEKVTYLEVKYGDLEEFIQEVYNRPDYDILGAQEWGNDSSYDFRIDGIVKDYDESFLEEFKTGKHSGDYRLYNIMNDMCRNEIIKPGNYLVQVCW